jgi:hypothetical protein
MFKKSNNESQVNIFSGVPPFFNAHHFFNIMMKTIGTISFAKRFSPALMKLLIKFFSMKRWVHPIHRLVCLSG